MGVYGIQGGPLTLQFPLRVEGWDFVLRVQGSGFLWLKGLYGGIQTAYMQLVLNLACKGWLGFGDYPPVFSYEARWLPYLRNAYVAMALVQT